MRPIQTQSTARPYRAQRTEVLADGSAAQLGP